jgi:hypothetical protein
MTCKTTLFKSLKFLSLALTAFFTLTSAQAQRNLTVTLNPNVPVITIVDQDNGAIETCTAIYGSTVTATCRQLGSTTPATSLPVPPVGLSVYLSPVLAQTGADTLPNYLVNNVYAVASGYYAPIWIINNSTGAITFCYSVSGQYVTNSGSCISLGVAP